MVKQFTCIECPVGCLLTVEGEGKKIISVTGNSCPRGKAYAESEFTAPGTDGHFHRPREKRRDDSRQDERRRSERRGALSDESDFGLSSRSSGECGGCADQRSRPGR